VPSEGGYGDQFRFYVSNINNSVCASLNLKTNSGSVESCTEELRDVILVVPSASV
jgi:hypothetical protein